MVYTILRFSMESMLIVNPSIELSESEASAYFVSWNSCNMRSLLTHSVDYFWT